MSNCEGMKGIMSNQEMAVVATESWNQILECSNIISCMLKSGDLRKYILCSAREDDNGIHNKQLMATLTTQVHFTFRSTQAHGLTMAFIKVGGSGDAI